MQVATKIAWKALDSEFRITYTENRGACANPLLCQTGSVSRRLVKEYYCVLFSRVALRPKTMVRAQICVQLHLSRMTHTQFMRRTQVLERARTIPSRLSRITFGPLTGPRNVLILWSEALLGPVRSLLLCSAQHHRHPLPLKIIYILHQNLPITSSSNNPTVYPNTLKNSSRARRFQSSPTHSILSSSYQSRYIDTNCILQHPLANSIEPQTPQAFYIKNRHNVHKDHRALRRLPMCLLCPWCGLL